MPIKFNNKNKNFGCSPFFKYAAAALFAAGTAITMCFALPHSEAAIKKARDYINLSQYNKAYSILSEVIESEESSHEAFYLAGLCMQKQNNDIAAEKHLKQALELKPDDYDTKKLLSALYLGFAKQAQSNSDINEMYNYMLKACRVNPSLTRVWEAVMERWFNAGKYDLITAEGELLLTSNEKILAQGEDVHIQAALIIVAKAWFAKHNAPEAERFIKFASMIRQANDELYSFKRELHNEAEKRVKELADKAKELAEKGSYKEAIEIIEAAQKMPGARASTLAERKEAYTKELNFQAAITKLNQLDKQKKYVEILEEIPNLLLEFPDNEKLISLFDSATEKLKKEKAEKEKANIARIAEQMKRHELISNYNAFIKDGQKEEKQKNYLQAVICYENALKLRPADEKLKKHIEDIKATSERLKARERAYLSDFSKMTALFAEQKYKNAYESALEMFRKYDEHKDDISVYMSESAFKCGLYKEASNAAECFKDIKEKENLYNYIKGMSAYNLDNYDEALALLNKIKKPEPSFTGITSAIAVIYVWKFRVGLYILALGFLPYIFKSLKSALKNMKRQNMIKRLSLIQASGQYAENLQFLEEHYQKDDLPNRKLLTTMLAEALLKTGDSKRAYDLVSDLMKRDMRNQNLRRLAGEAALASKDTSASSIEYINGLLKINEARKDVVAYLAEVYMKQNAEHKLAKEMIEKYLAVNPNAKDALYYLANLYIKRAAYNAQTLKTFEKCLKLSNDIPEYHKAVIDCYLALGSKDEAEKRRAAAAELFKQDYRFAEVKKIQTEPRPTSAFGGKAPLFAQSMPQPNQGASGQQPQNNAFNTLPPLMPAAPELSAKAEGQKKAPSMPAMPSLQPQNGPSSMPAMPSLQPQNGSSSMPAMPSLQPKNGSSSMPAMPSLQPQNGSSSMPTAPKMPAMPELKGQDTALNADKPAETEPFLGFELPDINTLTSNKIPPSKPQGKRISGPQKKCPHCGAANSVNEYYCTTCGKPFMG